MAGTAVNIKECGQTIGASKHLESFRERDWVSELNFSLVIQSSCSIE